MGIDIKRVKAKAAAAVPRPKKGVPSPWCPEPVIEPSTDARAPWFARLAAECVQARTMEDLEAVVAKVFRRFDRLAMMRRRMEPYRKGSSMKYADYGYAPGEYSTLIRIFEYHNYCMFETRINPGFVIDGKAWGRMRKSGRVNWHVMSEESAGRMRELNEKLQNMTPDEAIEELRRRLGGAARGTDSH